MAEDPADPPRKLYGLKPREFDAVNGPPRQSPPGAIPTGPDPGIPPVSTGPITLRDLTASAAGEHPALGVNGPVNRPNEVHALLDLNLRHDQKAGRFTVTPAEDPRKKRRIRIYWTALILFDVPLGLFAWSIGPSPGFGIPFVCAIGGIGMFTAVWTWQTWGLLTE